MWLSPLECLAVGYFVRYKSKSMQERSSLSLDLGNCSISDTSVRVLSKELKRDISGHTPGRVILLLAENTLTYDTLYAIKDLLKGQSNIEGVALQKCLSSDHTEKSFALKLIIEGLGCDSSCRHIAIGYNGLNCSHMYYLILMIRSCSQLNILNLSSSALCNIMPFLSKALSLSKLVCLQLNCCDIDDLAMVSLAKGISENSSLKALRLEVYGNPNISSDGFIEFVLTFKNNKSNLIKILTDPTPLLTVQKSGILEQINDIRKKNGCHELYVQSPQLEQALQMQNAMGTLHLDMLNQLS